LGQASPSIRSIIAPLSLWASQARL